MLRQIKEEEMDELAKHIQDIKMHVKLHSDTTTGPMN